MLDYEKFKKIFDEKIFAKSKPDLLKKVAEYPDRYVGLFRPTKPEAMKSVLVMRSRWQSSNTLSTRAGNRYRKRLHQKKVTRLILTNYLSKMTRYYSLSKRYATTMIQPKNVGRLATLKRSLRHLSTFMAIE